MASKKKAFPSKLMSAKEMAKTLDSITNAIHKGWLKDDMPVIRKMHPNALTVVPMYRSALVVEKQTSAQAKRGQVSVIVYHDPAWMGGSTKPKDFRHHSWRLLFNGQRSGPDVYVYEKSRGCDCSSFLRSIVGPLLEQSKL